MHNPLVSIIIPVYNCEKHLVECIESAINQTYTNIEIIIINDGSTDNSLSIAEKYKTDNVKIYLQKNNGASSARNLGLTKSHGEYIQFLDADDFISLDKIENQVKLALENPNKLIGCSTVHFNNQENLKYNSSDKPQNESVFEKNNSIDFLVNLWGVNDGIIHMVQPNAWLTPINIIKRTGYWNEELTLDDDGEYFCRIILNSKGIVYDNLSINYYRKYTNSKSISGGMDNKALLSQFNALQLKKEYLFANAKNNETKTAIANLYMSFCFITYKKDKYLFFLANSELKELKTKPNIKINLGGKMINLLAFFIGWKNARTLSIWKNQIKKKHFNLKLQDENITNS